MSTIIPASLGVVTVRFLEPKDHQAYVALEKSAVVRKYVSGPARKTEEELLDDLRRYQPTTEVMAIAETATNSYIGRCGLLPIHGASEAEVFCLLAESHWRQGIGEVVIRFLAGAASQQGMKAVGIVHPENQASLGLLKKLGWLAAGSISEPGNQQGHLRYVEPAA